MRCPRNLLILCMCAAVLVSGAAWLVTPSRQPACDGRSLTEWMAALGSSDTDEEPHAFAAIEAIGTNALPVIVPLLDTRDSAIQFRLLRLVQRAPFFHLQYTTAAEIRQKAKTALLLAGEESMRASIQDLIRLSRDKDPGVRLTAVELLSTFTWNETAPLPALEAAQADPDPRVRATAMQTVQWRRAIDRAVRRRRELSGARTSHSP